jgi:hypothetical protein
LASPATGLAAPGISRAAHIRILKRTLASPHVDRCARCEQPAKVMRATGSYYLSNLPLETKAPAGNSPGRRNWEVEMLDRLYFLLLIMVILGLRVKITIDRE